MDEMERFYLRCTKYINNGRLICPGCVKLLTADKEFCDVVEEVSEKTVLSLDEAAAILTQYAF